MGATRQRQIVDELDSISGGDVVTVFETIRHANDGLREVVPGAVVANAIKVI